MPEYKPYSNAWIKEISKLPKGKIVEIFQKAGQSKDKIIASLEKEVAELKREIQAMHEENAGADL